VARSSRGGGGASEGGGGAEEELRVRVKFRRSGEMVKKVPLVRSSGAGRG
jgi:hypothetical protein